MRTAWNSLLSKAELITLQELTANLDASFAAKEKAFYESRTQAELRSLAHGAWLANDPTSYQLARSYAALQVQP